MFKQEFQDQQLQCADCGESFVFSAEDQDFYFQKRYSTPKRCPICRANRKMNDPRNSGRSQQQGRGGYGSSRPQFQVICSSCGCETTVPFEPSGDRPVFCSDCYRNSY